MPEAEGDRVTETRLPAGIRRVAMLGPHGGRVGRIAWSASGELIAVPVATGSVLIWDLASGDCVHELPSDSGEVNAVDFDASGRMAASVSERGKLTVWDVESGAPRHVLRGSSRRDVAFAPTGRGLVSTHRPGRVRLWTVGDEVKLVHELDGHTDVVTCIAFNATGTIVATGSMDRSIRLWNAATGKLVRVLVDHADGVLDVAFHPAGMLASASDDGTIKLWHRSTGRLLRTLEGHTGGVRAVSFESGVHLLASSSFDGSIRLWDPETGEAVATIAGRRSARWQYGLAFHPSLPRLACSSSSGRRRAERHVDVFELDLDVLLRRPRRDSITYTSAKIVLVGDSGVGKTGLGWRLANDEFIDHPSTHGQQFWLLDRLGATRRDGTQCEAVLWDLAGQPDYRLIHALFLDDADVALVLFDPTRDDDPLHGVDYWLRQLAIRPFDGAVVRPRRDAILVAARADRGASRLTADEIELYRSHRGFIAFVTTSALTGEGLETLVAAMTTSIRWEGRATTVTTETFKHIKDHVLGLKERAAGDQVVLSAPELHARLKRANAPGFGQDELRSAVGHLSNHGYVTRLRTSKGEERILLAPELLNNVASSIVLEARRNPRGLGSLEEQQVLAGAYQLPELEALSTVDRDVLLDSAIAMFLSHNLCFRRTDPLSSRVYLVFPELMNLRKPGIDDGQPIEQGVAYTATGAVENLYASLVVLLGYTSTFTRANQWRDHARYVVGDGLICGFRLDAEREGERDFVLYFGTRVGRPIRTLFQSLFESFLASSTVMVRRYEPVICSSGHYLNRAAAREQIVAGRSHAFCTQCGERVSLPASDTPITLTDDQAADLHGERREVAQRSRFEQAVFRLKAHMAQHRVTGPNCFVSYAHGERTHERWVETFANDLVKAGISVLLDRWESDRAGTSLSRFVEQIEQSDRVIVVGTRLYRTKYDNRDPEHGFVVASEGELIGARMLGPEAERQTVLPLLLEGTQKRSFPPLLHSRVYADFRDQSQYYSGFLRFVLALYDIPARHPIESELRRVLKRGSP